MRFTCSSSAQPPPTLARYIRQRLGRTASEQAVNFSAKPFRAQTRLFARGEQRLQLSQRENLKLFDVLLARALKLREAISTLTHSRFGV